MKLRGLGMWNAAHLAHSAFLTPAAGCSNLVHHILSEYLQDIPIPNLYEAMSFCSRDDDQLPLWLHSLFTISVGIFAKLVL